MTDLTRAPLIEVSTSIATHSRVQSSTIVKHRSRRPSASPSETVIGLFKAEVIYARGPWRNFEIVEYATLEWVDWFNNRRLLEPIGHVPPAEFEEAYYRQQSSQPMAA